MQQESFLFFSLFFECVEDDTANCQYQFANLFTIITSRDPHFLRHGQWANRAGIRSTP